MCRIFGHFNGSASREELRTVSARQRHGGPDASSVVRGPGWALGCNRLAIMDLAGGDQPYDLGGIKVVFNGEIYNHVALRRELATKGYRFPDHCDGSILPALYAEEGQAFVDRLDGMFAIAIVDLRASPQLVMVTDELGMKPLYYSWDAPARELYFASEIPALLSFDRVVGSPRIERLDAYLATRAPFGEETMFTNVRSLPQAATLTFGREEGLRIVRRDARGTIDTERPDADLSASADALRELLRDEVTRLMQADVPVSAITSGGLDSSLVTALAAEVTRSVDTFNLSYRGEWPLDERAFASLVAAQAGTRHHQVEVDSSELVELLPKVIWHLGQPNADPIAVSTYALFSAVRRAGFKVALTGDGADELFAGYDRLRAAMAVPAGGDWVTSYVEALSAIPTDLRHRLYTSEYRHYVTGEGGAASRIAGMLDAYPGSRLEALLRLEASERLPAYHLRRVDHLSMAHGVEVRLPFCQPAVGRFAQGLPERFRIDAGEGKRVLYRAAAGLLPPAILTRPKQPFTLPIEAMLQPGQPLFEYAQDVLATANLRSRSLLDPAAIQRLFAEQATRPSGRVALAVWALLVFELWLDEFATKEHTAADGAITGMGQ